MLHNDILIAKLKYYGIDDTPLVLLKSNLTIRMQFVKIKETRIEFITGRKGCPTRFYFRFSTNHYIQKLYT